MLDLFENLKEIIKTILLKCKNFVLFFLLGFIGNIILRSLSAVIAGLVLILEVISWILKNIFFVFKELFIFIYRLFYVFFAVVLEFVFFIFFNFVKFVSYYIIFFFNYIILRLQQIKILAIKLNSINQVKSKTLNYVTVFTRLKHWILSFSLIGNILFFFYNYFSTILTFIYEIISSITLLFFVFLFKVFEMVKFFVLVFYKIINNIINFFFWVSFNFYRKIIKIFFNFFFKFFYKIKLNWFLLKLNFLKFLKKRNKFLYGFFMYMRPGYIFLVIYIYILVILPFLLDFGSGMLTAYYDLSYDNWSWYGSYFPLNDFFVNLIPNNETLKLYNNKPLWFYKIGDPADVFLFSIIISISYFLAFLPYMRYIWFQEPDWEVNEIDVEEDDFEWEEELEDEVIGDPADTTDVYQDGEELDDYYDELREKSLVRGRVGNNTVSNGHILATESGWGFFISYWIFALFYSIKTFFWPETGWSPSFQIYDFEETVANSMPFLEYYPLRNLQIYSAWMPGSPFNSPWVAQDWHKWRLYSLRKVKGLDVDVDLSREFLFDKWNNRLYRGFGELIQMRKVRFATGTGRMSTITSGLFFDASYRISRDDQIYFDKEFPYYDHTDIFYEMYGNYPVGMRNTLWKRSIWYSRSLLNPTYNLGFNYLDFWPREDMITPEYFSISIDPYFKNEKYVNAVESSFSGNGDKRNFMLNKTYKYFVYDGNEAWDYPLTYSDDIRNGRKSGRFRKRFFRGHINYLDTSVETNEGSYEIRALGESEFLREPPVPYYGTIYDIGLTPYHLGVSNSWWKWMEKPLTTDPISIKYFLAYMSTLSKDFSNSYNRFIIYKLWHNYWSGKFRVGDIFLNSNIIKKYMVTDLGNVYTAMAEMKRVRRGGLLGNYGVKSKEEYEELWLDLEKLQDDILDNIRKYDLEMFDLDFSSNYGYPASQFDELNFKKYGFDSLFVSSMIYNPLVDIEDLADMQEIFEDQKSPLSFINHYFEGSLVHEEAGHLKVTTTRTARNASNNFFRKDVLGVYIKHPDRYSQKVDQLKMVSPVREISVANLDRAENLLYDLKNEDVLKIQNSIIDDMVFDTKTFKKYLKFFYYPTLGTQIENLKSMYKELLDEAISDLIFEEEDFFDLLDGEKSFGLRMFPYESEEGFNNSPIDPSLWEELYKQVRKELKSGKEITELIFMAEDRPENVKPIILKKYKKKLKRLLKLGVHHFDQYKNYRVQPFLYDIKFRDLLYKELNYPLISDNFYLNGFRLRWKFDEIFVKENPIYSILEDSLYFNVNKNNLEREFPLYRIPLNMYMDQDYIFVKDKILKLTAQSLGVYDISIENFKILNKLKRLSQIPLLSHLYELFISVSRKILRLFFINVDFFYEKIALYLIDKKIISLGKNDKFFYVFDNFDQSNVGFDENVILYKIDFYDYKSNISYIDGGSRINTKFSHNPSVFDNIPGALIFPSKKGILFLDSFFARNRNVYFYKDCATILGTQEYGILSSKMFFMKYDVNYFVPKFKFGYDIEHNLIKTFELNKNLVRNSFLEINYEKLYLVSRRLENDLNEDIDKLSRNLRSVKFFRKDLLKNKGLFFKYDFEKDFFKYLSKKEDLNLYWNTQMTKQMLTVEDDFYASIDLHYDFWRGELTMQYLLSFDFDFLNRPK